MTRFRPAVEPLDARTLPSAVLADPPAAPPSAVAHLGEVPGQPGDEAALSLNFTKITFKTLQVAAQDLNFTVTLSKASPKL